MTDTSSETTQTPTPTGRSGMPAMARSLQEEMDRMFRAFSMPQMSWQSTDIPGDGALGLRVDIGETDSEIHVEADLPRVPEDAVEVTLEDDILRIRAEKSTSADRSDKTMRVIERSHGVFERAIRVPAGIDPGSVRAEFDKGVLSVTLPKPAGAASKAHRIAIGRPG